MAHNDRTFAQGSLGEQGTPKIKKISVFTRLKYNFENSISSGNSFGVMLIIVSLILAVVMTAIKAAVAGIDALNVDVTADGNYLDKYWASLSTILNLAFQTTWAARIISVLNWIIAIAITGTVIGFITTTIAASIAKLKSGGSAVIDSGHTLILGWSPRVFPIIRELAVAKASESRPSVVIFSELSRESVMLELSRRVGKLGKLKVVVRTGKPTIPSDLLRTNLSAASSIIILDNNDNADATTISIVLSIKAAVGDAHPPIVAEIDDAYVAETLQMSSKQVINAVRSHDVIARMTAQASRQPGLAAVILDLVDFDGNEIYFTQVPELEGKTYADALAGFATSSTIGLSDAVNGLRLNPTATTVIPAGASIVVIAEDDSTATYSPVTLEAGRAKPTKKRPAQKPENLLVIGWSAMGRSVMEAMAEFLPKGSTINIVARTQFVDPALFDDFDLGHVAVTHRPTSGRMVDLIAAAEAQRYDAVIVLGYRNGIETIEADAQTMLTMLQMNALFEDNSNKVHPTRLVAEILDSTMMELAQAAASDDLVVSDVFAALLIAQISENAALAGVFADLFDADGAQIEMEPISLYAAVGEEVAFGTLVARASVAGGSAFGYRAAGTAKTDPSKGVTLNPAKSQVFTVAEGDSLVVVRD